MEATQNYENSAQSLQKSLKGIEKREKLKSGKKDQRRKKHSDTSETSGSSSSTAGSSNTESSGSDSGPSSGKRSNRIQKGKEIWKVKVEDDKKQIMKSIQESLEAIKVNLADNQKPRRIVPTSRANVWCTRCRENGHYASECYKGPQKQMHFVDPETGVYYTILDKEDEPETNPVYQVQPVYGRGKGVTPLIRTNPRQQSGQIGSNQVMIPQTRYPVGVCWNCGDPSHYASACPVRPRQGAPLPLSCQNCGE